MATNQTALQRACQRGNMHFVERYYPFGRDEADECLVIASLFGHLMLVQYFVKNGASDYDTALAFASRGGHLKIMNWFVQEMPEVQFDFNRSLAGAYYGQQKRAAEWALQKGATNISNAQSWGEEGKLSGP